MACCALPHDPMISCEEIAWAASAPTEDEAFRRAMLIAERINGRPVEDALQHRRGFREHVRLLGQRQDRKN